MGRRTLVAGGVLIAGALATRVRLCRPNLCNRATMLGTAPLSCSHDATDA